METNQQPFKVDLKTFNQLFSTHYPALRAYAGLLVGDGLGEDIVQDLFLYAWENRDHITIHTSIKAYLFKSIHNRCLNSLTRTKTIQDHRQWIEHDQKMEELQLLDPEKNQVIRRLYMNELRHEIHEAIDSLPGKCKEVFKLSYLSDYKNKQISQLLNISVSTVEKHINHALKTLRNTLQHVKGLLLNLLIF